MIIIQVVGVPAPQGSKSAVLRGSHAVLLEGASTVGRQKHQAWREAVAWQSKAATAKHGPFADTAALSVDVVFVLPRPTSRPKRAVWADRKPDLDKLIRSTLDGLCDGGLFVHDSRVVRICAEKLLASPGQPTGAHIDIIDITDARSAR